MTKLNQTGTIVSTFARLHIVDACCRLYHDNVVDVVDVRQIS